MLRRRNYLIDNMLVINPRKPKKLKNNTKFFNPDVSRSHNIFTSPNSYQSRQIKIEGYETRLYWQFRYCEEHQGQTFFYTLTYNDKAMPKYKLGMKYDKATKTKVENTFNCFDYEDLRDLLTGGFRKQLLRKYGMTFKYFIGAELGDGKGERGMHNNPHYHVLFFLEPANNPRFPYQQITPEDFRHLVRLYWQGFDEYTDGFTDYNEAKYGIAKEGDNVGKVTDFRACCYCAKYVCKDVKLQMNEKEVTKRLRFMHKKSFDTSAEFCKWFFYNVLYDVFNEPLNDERTEWKYDEIGLIRFLVPHYFDYLDGFNTPYCRRVEGEKVYMIDELIERFYMKPEEPNEFVPVVTEICRKKKMWKAYWNYFHEFVDKKVTEGLNEYRNRYCNKVRCSQGVGKYALEFITDKMNPTVQVPNKKGFKNRPLPMYLYRQLYMDVVKDNHDMNHYVLNELGRQYKLANLPKQIEKVAEKAAANLELIRNDEALFEKMRESDVNTDVWLHFSQFLKSLDYLLEENNINQITQRYAEYKLIYENRFFPYQADGNYNIADFPDIDILCDYATFLVPTIYSVSRSDLRYSRFFETGCPNHIPYSQHPYFLRYINVFSVLDLCSDYFFVQGDIKAQQEAEERARTKRFHTERKLKEFYATFGMK